MNRKKGIIFAALSAVIFGFNPTIARMVFANGGNSTIAVFLRSLLSVPVLLGIVLVKKIPMKMSKAQWIDILLLGALGVAATGYTLISSYNYIPGGLATTLHFIYPALTALAGWLIFKERLGLKGIAALIIITSGVFLFSANTAAAQPAGVILALISGCTYAFYTVYLGRSRLVGQNVFLLNFYFMLVSSVCFGIVGFAGGTLTLGNLNATGWLFAFISATFVSVLAFSLYQLGVLYAGATTTAMMSALEPATSIIFGFLLAREVLSVTEIIGCAAVLAGILLLLPAKSKEKPAALNAENSYTEPKGVVNFEND